MPAFSVRISQQPVSAAMLNCGERELLLSADSRVVSGSQDRYTK